MQKTAVSLRLEQNSQKGIIYEFGNIQAEGQTKK
jgi:hypothetical protein